MDARRGISAVFGALVALLASAAAAQTPVKPVDAEDVKTLERRLDGFFSTLTKRSGGGPDAAFKDLLVGGPLEPREQEVKGLIDQAKKLEGRFGEFGGVEKVRQKSVGEDVCVMTYLYKARLYPVAWHFLFYRPPGAIDRSAWVCIGVRFDSKVEELAQ